MIMNAERHARLLLEAADAIDASAAMQSDGLDELTGRLRQTAEEIFPTKPGVQQYFVLHAVRWQPKTEMEIQDNPPMDRDHLLQLRDQRHLTCGLVEIGSLEQIARFIDNAL